MASDNVIIHKNPGTNKNGNNDTMHKNTGIKQNSGNPTKVYPMSRTFSFLFSQNLDTEF